MKDWKLKKVEFNYDSVIELAGNYIGDCTLYGENILRETIDDLKFVYYSKTDELTIQDIRTKFTKEDLTQAARILKGNFKLNYLGEK